MSRLPHRKAQDLITLSDAMQLVNLALRQYHHDYHRPWYVRLWQRVRR